MFIPHNSKIGTQVQLLEDVSTCSGTFTKGHILTITGETERGYDLEDADGNRILEAGFSRFVEVDSTDQKETEGHCFDYQEVNSKCICGEIYSKWD